MEMTQGAEEVCPKQDMTLCNREGEVREKEAGPKGKA